MAHRCVADLPFGTQKRVELARALAARPKLLLLDEPAGGLNHHEVDELGQLFRRMRDERRVTLLLVEHHMGLVMSISDRVVALDFGRKIAEGSPGRRAKESRRHSRLSRTVHTMTKPLLTVRGLNAFYGETQVLHGLDFEVAEGGITALLGANGAGKTSTLRALSGMIRATGEIVFGGVSICGRVTEEIARLGIAHVPEGRGTFSRMTVDENLQLGAMARSDRAGIAADIERLYGFFPILDKRRGQQAGTLSGGEQQMLAIARALMLRPRLMLLDEPSFGLAPMIVAEVFDILRKLNEDDGMSILLVEQNAAAAIDLADQAYLLETGNLVMGGAARDIGRDENVRRAYLGY